MRDEPADLAAHGGNGVVAEEGAGSVAGAVDDGPLGQRGEVGGVVELLRENFAAGDEEVVGEAVGVVRDVEHELRVATGKAGGEGMGAGREVERARHDVLDAVVVVCEADRIVVDAALVVLLGGDVGQDVAVGELDGCTGDAEVALVRTPGGAGHLLPERGEVGASRFCEGDAGVGRPGAGGAEAACV